MVKMRLMLVMKVALLPTFRRTRKVWSAIAKAGYTGKVVIGMDVAASEFYKDDKTYDLNFKEELDDRAVDAAMNKLLKNYKTCCKYLGRKHSLSEVFVTTQGGNFPHFLMDHRRYLNRGHAKTIMPDKKKLALIFDDPDTGRFGFECWCLEGWETNCFGLVSNWGFVRGLRLEKLVLNLEIGTVKFGARLFESGKLLFADSFEGLLLPCAQLELDAQVLQNRGTGGGLFEFGFVELIFERVGLLCIIPAHR
ncbi:hypothetical protein Droror1_Dr00017738 [Drosera rotundifolia]